MSIKEINDEVEAYEKNKEDQLRFEISIAHRQASWIAVGFNSPKKFPALHDEFPDLFFPDEPEKKKKVKKMEKWEIEKMKMALYAQAHNAKFEKSQEVSTI